MAPKRRGKGSKLAKMTEEERIRYLQHRAAMEEEARRRKQQLIATFMKIKLKHEEAFTRLNLAKINQQWRQILRQIKCKELKQELEVMEETFTHIIECKDRIIQGLIQELDEAEEQYERNFQSHAEVIDKLIALHKLRLDELYESYQKRQQTFVSEAKQQRQEMLATAQMNEDHLKTITFIMVSDMEEWMQSKEKKHVVKSDEVRDNMLSILDDLQIQKESQLEALWRDFQNILKEYTTSTENVRNQYEKLKEKDEISSKLIAKQSKMIQSLEDTIADLKAKQIVLKNTKQREIDDMKLEHKVWTERFWKARNRLTTSRELDKKQLITLTTESNKAIKHLESLLQKAEKILQLGAMSRKLETEQEKILPFSVTGLGMTSMLSQEECDSIEVASKEELREALSQEIIPYNKLDNFWRRYNRAYLECAALTLHREALKLENQQLTKALQQYLATLAEVADQSSTKALITSASPSAKHVINLMPNDEQSKPASRSQSGHAPALRTHGLGSISGLPLLSPTGQPFLKSRNFWPA